MAKSFELVYLGPDQVQFERRGDTLSLTVDGTQHYPRVVLRPCFPVSMDRNYLSVRDANGEEQPELGVIEDWTVLAEPDRQAVAEELGLYYFVPAIQRVHEIKDELGFLYWSVETDKGPRSFVMRNNVIQQAREVAPGRWLLIDVNQARYEIRDLRALDRQSQKMVENVLSL
jgi:hypothetical protein